MSQPVLSREELEHFVSDLEDYLRIIRCNDEQHNGAWDTEYKPTSDFDPSLPHYTWHHPEDHPEVTEAKKDYQTAMKELREKFHVVRQNFGTIERER